jgi:hypothetical protein
MARVTAGQRQSVPMTCLSSPPSAAISDQGSRAMRGRDVPVGLPASCASTSPGLSSRHASNRVPPDCCPSLGLEPMPDGCACGALRPHLLRADQPHGRISGQPCGIVQVFIPRQPAVDRPLAQIRQRARWMALRVGLHRGLLDHSGPAEASIAGANAHHTPVGGHPRILKLHAQALMARELTADGVSHPYGAVLRKAMVT